MSGFDLHPLTDADYASVAQDIPRRWRLGSLPFLPGRQGRRILGPPTWPLVCNRTAACEHAHRRLRNHLRLSLSTRLFSHATSMKSVSLRRDCRAPCATTPGRPAARAADRGYGRVVWLCCVPPRRMTHPSLYLCEFSTLSQYAYGLFLWAAFQRFRAIDFHAYVRSQFFPHSMFASSPIANVYPKSSIFIES